MTLRGVFLGVSLLMLAIPTIGRAGTIYNESVNGDLSADPTTVLSLSLGTNTVLGSSSFAGQDAFSGDFDSFSFTVPTGAELTSVSYAFSDLSALPGTTELITGYNLRDSSSNNLSTSQIDLLGTSPVSQFVLVLPIFAGQYQMYNAALGCASGDCGGQWDYAITLVITSSTPLPGSLVLFGTIIGLIGSMLGLRRSRFTSATIQ